MEVGKRCCWEGKRAWRVEVEVGKGVGEEAERSSDPP